MAVEAMVYATGIGGHYRPACDPRGHCSADAEYALAWPNSGDGAGAPMFLCTRHYTEWREWAAGIGTHAVEMRILPVH